MKNHLKICSNLQNHPMKKSRKRRKRRLIRINNLRQLGRPELFAKSGPYQKRNRLTILRDDRWNILLVCICISCFNINKRMFYINTSRKGGPIKQKQLLDAMLVPPEERLTKDHQIIYRFFIDSQMLKQLERTKSLNARIKCIAAMQLINRVDFSSEEHLLMHVFEDQRAIILPKIAKDNAETYNQKLIRRKMDLLNTFSMMQLLKYDELLYLAFNMEEISCKYKDYLYREGETPNQFYLIVEGQFHYIKDCKEHQPKIKINKKDKAKKLKSIDQDEQSPNKYVKPNINRYKVGIVEGKLGQAVGLEELIIQEYKNARRYSVFCNSTDNKCIRINKNYIQTLFQELPFYYQQICNQIRDSNNAKIQLFQKIKLTKSTLKKQMQKSIEKVQRHQQRYEQVQMRSLQKSNDSSMSKLKLPLLPKKSSFSNDYRSRDRSRIYSSALTSSIKSQENHMKSLKSQSNLDVQPHEGDIQLGENEGSFALTGLKLQSNRKPVRSPSNEPKQAQSNRITELRESLQSNSFDPSINLPLIGKKSIADIDGNSISLKHINVRSKNRAHQYGGMIDCNKLVQQKQDIFERKNNKTGRQDIFPIGHIDYKQLKKGNTEDPMKLKASPAHSNRFMQKLLLKVLKKAGYDETEKDVQFQKKETPAGNSTVNVKPAVSTEFHRSLTKHKRKDENRQNKTANKQQLLVNSPFDDCYFAKI